jgi:hypothetical protein
LEEHDQIRPVKHAFAKLQLSLTPLIFIERRVHLPRPTEGKTREEMKTSLLILAIFLLPTFTLEIYPQVSRGIVKEGLTLESKILGKPVRYTVYLPFDYSTSERYYPVVYLLHAILTMTRPGFSLVSRTSLLTKRSPTEPSLP